MTDPTVADARWLRGRVGELIGAPEPPGRVPLRDLGLRSVDLVILLADLELRLGIPLDDDDLDDRNFVDVDSLSHLMRRVRGRVG